MKYAHKHLLVAGMLAAFGLTAGAQTPPPTAQSAPGQAPARSVARDGHSHADPARVQQRMARMQQRMARHLAQFKQKLQLSPAQESAWTSYLAALKPSGNFKRPDRAEFARLTTPERIDRMRAHRAERIAEMDRRGEATKTFYAALTPQQKQVFDEATARRGERHRGGHGGRHGHHHKG